MPDTLTAYAAREARLQALEPALFRRMRRALIQSAEPAAVAVEAGADATLAAAYVSTKQVAAVLEALYDTCGTAEAQLTYDELTPAVKALAPPALVSRWGQRLRSFITGEGAAAVRGITETTRKLVRDVLNEAAAAGDSVAVAAKKLRERVTGVAKERAVVIVRTELVAAANQGSLLGAQATGLRLEKFWISTKDGRTRPTHSAIDGIGAPLQDGMFSVGGAPARYPADPILPVGERANCRCSIGYRKLSS
jgi:hypothetical protein